jgi:hypothetical protein
MASNRTWCECGFVCVCAGVRDVLQLDPGVGWRDVFGRVEIRTGGTGMLHVRLCGGHYHRDLHGCWLLPI